MNTLSLVINDWISTPLPTLHTRAFDYRLLELKKIITFIGIRRSGKTSYLFQIMHHLLQTGIDRKQLIYINFEDERLYPLQGTELTQIIPTLEEVTNFSPKNPLYLFLDELHNIPYWSKWLRRLTEQYKDSIYFFVTGSSAKLLSREIATELSGRTISVEVYPFSFQEYVDFHKLPHHSKELITATQNYLSVGGFPETLSLTHNTTLLLQSYFESIVYKDLVHRFNIRSLRLFEDFLRLVIKNISQIVSLSKLENTLKSLGHKVSKATLSEYMNYAQEAYFLFRLPVFSYKIKNQMIYPQKLYGIDAGMHNALTSTTSDDLGSLFENMIFLELKRKNYELFYYLTQKHFEVDFLVKHSTELLTLIQVSISLQHAATKNRELRALFDAMSETNIKQGYIITLKEKETIQQDDKTITILPAHEFLLHHSLFT